MRGNVTALSDAAGDMVPGGADGLYVDDRRVLSRLRVTIAGDRPAPVARGAQGDTAEFLASARNLGSVSPDPVVEVHRLRRLEANGMVERLRLVSRTAEPLDASVHLSWAADDAPIASVKSGAAAPDPLTAGQPSSAGVTFEGARHRVEVRLDPEPTDPVMVTPDGDVDAFFQVRLAAGAPVDITLRVTTTRLRSSALDADPGGDRLGWRTIRVTGDDPRLERTIGRALADLQALMLTDPEEAHDVFAAAGTPWYLTLFGRDSIWTASLALPLGTDLARGTLRALGRRQGRVHDARSGEAPGKIPHELRRSTYVDPVTGMSLPAVYYGTVDATALWVVLLHDAWSWGMAADDVVGLLGVLDRALDWLRTDATPDGDGLLKYLDQTGTGLSNQGWKDSGDAVRFRDGTIADAPIALVEAQAYAVHAYECAARLADAFGREGAVDLRARAQSLRETIRECFWVVPSPDPTGDGPADPPYLGIALDGAGRLVDGLASNMGHVLGTETLTPAESARVATMLTEPDLLDGFGVRTLASDNGGYNPLGYHTGSIWTHDTAIAALGLATEGHRAAAVRVAATLLASAEAFDYRWPELYAGQPTMGRPAPYPAACRPQAWSAASAVALLTVALGLRPDPATRTLHVWPVGPAAYGAMRVEGLRFGAGEVDLDVARDGTVTITRATAGARVEVHPPTTEGADPARADPSRSGGDPAP